MSNKKHEVGADYEPVANVYGSYAKRNLTEQKIAYPGMLDTVGECRGKRILDFGCGVGQVSKMLIDRGAEVCAVDVAHGMVEAARELLGPAAEVVRIENSRLPNEWHERFDLAIACFVLCIMEATEILAAARAIRKVIKPGGQFIVLNTNWETCNGFEFVSFKLNRTESLTSGCVVSIETKGEAPVKINDYFWTQEDYCNMLGKAGFTQCHVRELSTQPDPQWIDEDKAPPFFLVVATK